MKKSSLGGQIIDYIRYHTKPEAWEEIATLLSQAFKIADDDSRARISKCHLRGDRKRAQDRFFYIQEALATEVTNWTTTTKYADHGGESYSQLENTGILLTAHIKPSDVFRLRKAKYRDDNAKHNAGLGHQSVFPFYVAQEPNDLSLPSKLNVIILACSPSSLQNQASPSQFKILVPFEKNNGYHVELDLDQFLAGYSDIDTQAPQDQAWPKLRRKMRQAEEEQENDSKS